jgi:hypothetical protein
VSARDYRLGAGQRFSDEKGCRTNRT